MRPLLEDGLSLSFITRATGGGWGNEEKFRLLAGKLGYQLQNDDPEQAEREWKKLCQDAEIEYAAADAPGTVVANADTGKKDKVRAVGDYPPEEVRKGVEAEIKALQARRAQQETARAQSEENRRRKNGPYEPRVHPTYFE